MQLAKESRVPNSDSLRCGPRGDVAVSLPSIFIVPGNFLQFVFNLMHYVIASVARQSRYGKGRRLVDEVATSLRSSQ